MPIYEYECRACRHRFELLVRTSSNLAEPGLECPVCRGEDLERLLSLFSVSSEGTAQLHLTQGRKLGEKERRDKMHAEVEATEHHHH